MTGWDKLRELCDRQLVLARDRIEPLWTRVRPPLERAWTVGRRYTPRDLFAWVFAGWAVWFMMRAHLRYIEHPYEQNTDESYLLAVGMRMLEGRMLPFVDGVAHTGPLFLYTGAAIAAFGYFSWLPIRIVAGVTFAGMCALVFLAGQQARRPFAGAVATIGIPIFSLFRFWPPDGIAYNAETPVVLFMLGSVIAIVRSVGSERTPSRAWAAVAGFCASCAALSKQVAGLQAGVAALVMLIATCTRDGLTWRARFKLLAWFAAAAIAPAALIFGWLAVNGALDDAYYYMVTYNRDIYMFHLRHETLMKQGRVWMETRTTEFMLCAAPLVWGFGQPFVLRGNSASWREALWRSTFPIAITGIALMGMIGARASMRDFDHYYFMAIPWYGLLMGSIAQAGVEVFDDRARWYRFASRVMMFLPLMYGMELIWETKKDRLEGWAGQVHHQLPIAQAAETPRVCKWVDEHSKPGDKLFVWGFRGELYVSCKRLPASRYVFTTFVAGFVPWDIWASHEQDNMLQVPGSRKILLEELEATKPPVIIDSGKSMGNRSMTHFEETNEYLRAHYDLVTIMDHDGVWVRRR